MAPSRLSLVGAKPLLAGFDGSALRSHPRRQAEGLEHGPRLGLGLTLLGGRIRIRHDAGARLDGGAAALEGHRTYGDAEIEVAPQVDVTQRAAVEAPARGLQLVDDLHGADLRRPRQGAGGEGRDQRVERVLAVRELADHGALDVHDVAITLDGHELRHRYRLEAADPPQVVA